MGEAKPFKTVKETPSKEVFLTRKAEESRLFLPSPDTKTDESGILRTSSLRAHNHRDEKL